MSAADIGWKKPFKTLLASGQADFDWASVSGAAAKRSPMPSQKRQPSEIDMGFYPKDKTV